MSRHTHLRTSPTVCEWLKVPASARHAIYLLVATAAAVPEVETTLLQASLQRQKGHTFYREIKALEGGF